MATFDYDQANRAAEGCDAAGRIALALELAGTAPMVSTNFRPGEGVILHLVTQARPGLPVLWVDHGYNTPGTYRLAEDLRRRLDLDLRLYLPRRTSAHREAVDGALPGVEETERMAAFTEEVKLEPFRRGLAELQPSLWFTALRRSQTANRATMAVFEPGDGLVKCAPLIDWSDDDLAAYLAAHDLPDEPAYFDPTKLLADRECGLHVRR